MINLFEEEKSRKVVKRIWNLHAAYSLHLIINVWFELCAVLKEIIRYVILMIKLVLFTKMPLLIIVSEVVEFSES